MTDVIPGPDTHAGMRYSWEWTPDEHRRLHRDLFRNARARFVLYAVFALCGLSVGSELWNDARRGNLYWSSLLPWVLILGFWVWLLKWQMPRAAIKSQQKFHSGARWMVLDEGEVQSGCAQCSARLDWSKFQTAVETRDFLLLFYTANCAVYLPKRAVSAPAELHGVRRMLREKLGKQAKLHAA